MGIGFVLQKPCGGCTACCSGPLPVPEYGVVRGKPCEHLCENGCGNYENRANICRDFSCVWKANFVPEALRPDRAKVICKWTADGSLLLVPTENKVSGSVINRWKTFARKTGQHLSIYDHKTNEEAKLV